jgi:hypothetical protein
MTYKLLLLGRANALTRGMSFTLAAIAIQIVVCAVAFFRERGTDERFAGEKLTYRS